MKSEELFSAHGWRVSLDEAPLPDGRMKKAVRVGRCDSVHILAFTDRDTILLLREFRPFYDQWIWMLPSGRVDKEDNSEGAAQRELQEEAGYRAEKIEYCYSARHSESFESVNHFFIAHDLTPAPLPQDEGELIEVHVVPLREAIERVLGSPQVHLPSAYALLRYRFDSQRTKP